MEWAWDSDRSGFGSETRQVCTSEDAPFPIKSFQCHAMSWKVDNLDTDIDATSIWKGLATLQYGRCDFSIGLQCHMIGELNRFN